MSKREIASLACKILGIFLIIQGANVLSNILSYSIATPSAVALNVIFSLVYILFGVLLWVLSDKLSAIMVTKGSHSPKDKGIGISDIQRVSFSVLGLYFIGNSLPKLVSNLLNMQSTFSGLPNFRIGLLLSLGGVITEFIIGIGIFFGSQGLVKFLEFLRTVGLKRDE